ncbi:MAG: DUF4443 domain-containing protein [Candidatus Hadarchaeales archaeon]
MARGPLPRFGEVHVRRALEEMEGGRISRKELCRRLGLGEGSVRSILKKLKREGLVTSSRAGHTLTRRGRLRLGRPLAFLRVEAGGLTVGKVDVATVVRGAANRVRKGVEQRDEAIKAGAKGATVLIFRKGRFEIPGLRFKVDRKLARELVDHFRLRDGDVVVIGTGDDLLSAEEGARAAASSLRRASR